MGKSILGSKTKVGSVVFGVGTVLVSVGSFLMGNIDAAACVEGCLVGVGALFVGLGIRDALSDLE